LSYLVVPDYTGRSHAQIDELYVRKIPARRFASTECTGDYGRDVVAEGTA
jgi:HJR/Mrr/RecB family endonuclease